MVFKFPGEPRFWGSMAGQRAPSFRLGKVRNRDFRASFEQLRAGRGALQGLYPFWLESQSPTRFHLRPILSLLRFPAFMILQS
jgi:hypothetical protein